MTVSHSSQLINIHIISDDNLRRFQTRQRFSVKDSAVQTCNHIFKSFFELYIIEGGEGLCGTCIRIQVKPRCIFCLVLLDA